MTPTKVMSLSQLGFNASCILNSQEVTYLVDSCWLRYPRLWSVAGGERRGRGRGGKTEGGQIEVTDWQRNGRQIRHFSNLPTGKLS